MPDFGDIRQLGYVVRDLAPAADAWSRELGVGPWTIIRNITLRSVYRGAPSEPLIDIALGYRGQMQIELIEQRNDAPSPYRPFIERDHYGLHHTAFLSERIDADVARAEAGGLRVACDIRMPMGGRYVYLQSDGLGPGLYIELLEATPMLRQMFSDGIAAAAAWDGSGEPVVVDFAALAR
jgi:glyoxalase/bleomycin resistance protein/dioxygenase superfamily protein